MNLKSPNNPNESQKIFYSVKNQIIKAVNSNSFPEKINFDNSIMSLKQKFKFNIYIKHKIF